MTRLALCSCLMAAVLTSSCATKALWRATDPDSYVRVRGDLVTEETLKKKGLKYFKSDKDHAFYVEKNGFDRFRDYTLRVFATPVTVAIDAAMAIFVIGTVGAAGEIEEETKDQCDQDRSCVQHKQDGTYSR